RAARRPQASAAAGRAGSRRLPRWDGAAVTRGRRDTGAAACAARADRSDHSPGRGVPPPSPESAARSYGPTRARGVTRPQWQGSWPRQGGAAQSFLERAPEWPVASGFLRETRAVPDVVSGSYPSRGKQTHDYVGERGSNPGPGDTALAPGYSPLPLRGERRWADR